MTQPQQKHFFCPENIKLSLDCSTNDMRDKCLWVVLFEPDRLLPRQPPFKPFPPNALLFYFICHQMHIRSAEICLQCSRPLAANHVDVMEAQCGNRDVQTVILKQSLVLVIGPHTTMFHWIKHTLICTRSSCTALMDGRRDGELYLHLLLSP